MGIRFVAALFTILASNSLWSQKIDNLISFRDIKADNYFRINYENDFFAASDHYYTQGYNLELVTPGMRKNPINRLFFKPEEAIFKFGLSVEHMGFTPKDYESIDIQFGDRPFAAAIMLRSFAIANDTISKRRIGQSLSLGLIGPGAFGKEMQVGIHKITGNKIPRGWIHQIKNDLVLNYRVDYEKQLFRFADFFTLNATTTFQIGTLFTNASFGSAATLGVVGGPFSGSGTKRGFEFYLYSQPVIRLIGYDATLQGGLFNKKSPYTLRTREIRRSTAQFDYGLVLKIKTLYFEYARTVLTREFVSGNSSKWGGFKIGFNF